MEIHMKIAVYCASGAGNRKEYVEAAEKIGKWIGENGHELVYGGSNCGLMGAVADAVLAEGGRVTGVVPDVPLIQARKHTGLTECIETADMAERRKLMMDLSDGYIALPGGPGTLDELLEILCMQRLELVKKPMVLYDQEGFYEPLKELFANMRNAGFAEERDFRYILISEDMKEIANFLQSVLKR